MSYLNIRIDNDLLDFEITPQNFFVSYSIKSLEDFSKIGGALTEKSLIIPCTKQNDLIFNKYWDISGDNVNESNFRNIEISDGGLYSFVGKCLLKSVDLYGDAYGLRGSAYRLACYSDNSTFIIDLENKLLADLSNLPTPITFNSANVLTGFNGEYNLYNWSFSLIKYGNWKTPGEVSLFESTPQLYIVPMIYNIFLDLGYTVQSNFLQLEECRRLSLPLVPFNNIKDVEGYAEAISNIEAIGNTTTNSAGGFITFDTQTIQPSITPNPYNLLTGEYTAPATGFYNLKATIKLENFSQVPAAIPYTIFVANVTQGTSENLANAEPGPGINSITLDIDKILQFNANDIIKIGLFTGGLNTVDITPLYFSILGEFGFVENLPIVFSLLLRDFKQKDLIAGMQELFNLNIETNSATRVVTIEPADPYISNDLTPESGFYNSVDSTKVFDLSGTHRLNNISAQKNKDVLYTFKKNDPTSAALDAGQIAGFNDCLYSFNGSRFKNGSTKRENSFFYKQPELIDNEVTTSDSPRPFQLPIIWPANYIEEPGAEWIYPEPQPRILTHNGRNGLTKINITETGGFIFPPYCFMLDLIGNGNPAINLSYSDISYNSEVKPGLIKRFFQNDLKREQTGKVLQSWVFWRGLDISNLTFRNKIYFDNNTFILQSIKNYNPLSNDASKTILLYDSPLMQGDENNIKENNNLGLINT